MQPELLLTQSESICRYLIGKGMTNNKSSIKNESINILLDFFSVHQSSFDEFISGLQ